MAGGLDRTTPATIARAGVLAAVALGVADALWRWRPPTAPAAGSPDAAIVVGCAWLAWILAGYLAVVVSVVSLAHVARAFGLATTSAQRIAPARLRRVIDAAISIGVTGALVGSVAAPAAAAMTTMDAFSRPPTVAGSPFDWPGLSPTVTAPTAHRAPMPHRVPATDNGHATTHRAHGSVVVEPGDTLWSIASRGLGAGASGEAITAAWHAWYAANRSTIGADPSLIRPGQQLVAPVAATAGTPPDSR